MNSTLGHLVYFSLADLQIGRGSFEEACRMLGSIPRHKDDFVTERAWQKLLSEMAEHRLIHGESHQFFYRPTDTSSIFELVVEDAAGPSIPAKVQLEKEQGAFAVHYTEPPSPAVMDFIRKTETAFCGLRGQVNTKHAEYAAEAYLDSLMAVKLNLHGRLYFVPRPHISGIPRLLRFLELLEQKKSSAPPLTRNSLPVPDCPVQRRAIGEEFQRSFQIKADRCIQTAEYLLESDSPSLSVRQRWHDKISLLLERKRLYEGILGSRFPCLDNIVGELMALQMSLVELPFSVSG